MSDATTDVAPHLPRPTTLASSSAPAAAAALLLRPSSAAAVAAAYSAVRLLLPVKTLPWDVFFFSFLTSLSLFTHLFSASGEIPVRRGKVAT